MCGEEDDFDGEFHCNQQYISIINIFYQRNSSIFDIFIKIMTISWFLQCVHS